MLYKCKPHKHLPYKPMIDAVLYSHYINIAHVQVVCDLIVLHVTGSRFFICSCSEETSKLEELQDKNVSQKEVLRNMTAKIEVFNTGIILYTELGVISPSLKSSLCFVPRREERSAGSFPKPLLAIQPTCMKNHVVQIFA